MAKKTQSTAVDINLPAVKCIVPVKGPASYGFNVVEIPQHLLDQCKVIQVVEPDIFSICDTQTTKALRDIFEI